MKTRDNRRLGLLLLTLLGVGLAASCSVSKDGLTFDDEEFARLSGDDDGAGTGGSDNDPGEGGANPGGGGEGTGGSTVIVGVDAECEPGQLRCDGTQVQVCSAEAWLDVGAPCEFVCEAGLCTGVCEPGTTECLSEFEQRTCTDDGQWDADSCQYVCVDGACGGECDPNNTRCGAGPSPIPIESCSGEGAWATSAATCPNACDDSSGFAACVGACADGDKFCEIVEGSPPVAVACDAGSFTPGIRVTCDNATDGYVCKDGVCTGVCIPGTKLCGGAGNRTLSTCNADGQWQTSTVCDYVCTTGGCAGVCVPGDSRCFNDNVQSCNASGQWVGEEKCPSNLDPGLQRCIYGGEEVDKPMCGECQPLSAKSGDYVTSCGLFTAIQHCSFEGRWTRGDKPGASISECAELGDWVCDAGKCIEQCPAVIVGEGPHGCYKEGTGWYCPSRSEPPKFIDCDCRDGIWCQDGAPF